MDKKQKTENLWNVIVSYDHDDRVSPELFRNLLRTQSAIYARCDAGMNYPRTAKFMISVWQELIKDFLEIGDVKTAKKYRRFIRKAKKRIIK